MTMLKPALFIISILSGFLFVQILIAPVAFAEHAAKEKPPQTTTLDSADKEVPNEKTDGKQKPVTNPTMADVKKYYNAGNYRGVIAAVNKMKPSMMGHYYKGLAHQGVNQNYKAAIEYNYVRNNAINPQLKYNATRALSSLYKQKKRANSTRWFKNKHIEDEYDRYPESGGNEADLVDLSEHARKWKARNRLRRPDQDAHWNKYKVKQAEYENYNKRRTKDRY